MTAKELAVGAIAATLVTGAAVIGIQSAAAANKTATLVPPATAADVRAIKLTWDGTTSQVVVAVDACAKDTVTGATDCDLAVFKVNPANAQVSALYTAAINAWNTRKGY